MPTISLPTECLELIFGFLHQDMASLYRLLFVNRHFFQLTVPVLYQSPFKLVVGISDHGGNSWTKSLLRTELLVRLLLQSIQTNTRALSPRAPQLIELEDVQDNFQESWDALDSLTPPSLDTFASTTNSSVVPTSISSSLESPSSAGKPLLMDYFYFYTHHDHRSIASALSFVFPGSGQRVYDRILADLELAILMHNPEQIQSIRIHNPNLVIPHLLRHIARFELLSTVEIMDANWTRQELASVHSFLVTHATMFPGVSKSDKEDHMKLDLAPLNSILRSDQRMGRPTPAIRHFKYRTSRSHWTDTKLLGRDFDPLQLALALGPGLETIDSVFWPRTKEEDVNRVDLRFLVSLKISYLSTPHEGNAFSRPEFLSQCRRLEHLDVFTSTNDMLGWAVQEWISALPSVSNLTKSVSTLLSNKHPEPLVRLRHLRVHGPTDNVVFDVLRDALFGFRNSLQRIEARSDLEYFEGPAKWMDHADDLLAEYNHGGPRQRSTETRSSLSNPMDAHRAGTSDEECYHRMLSVRSSALHVQWTVPLLTMLDLMGPIAFEFDLDSLRFMPRLQTVCFSISSAPAMCRKTTRHDSASHRYSNSESRSGPKKHNMNLLPYVSRSSLRRVMIRGPWPEITDRSLQEMIEVCVVERFPNGDQTSGTQDDDEDARWGDQLIELTILDNERVSVQGMVQLARQMDELQIMGLSLNFAPLPTSTFSGYGTASSRRSHRDPLDEREAVAKDVLLKAQVEMPWIDLGPEAHHFGRRLRRDGLLSASWIL